MIIQPQSMCNKIYNSAQIRQIYEHFVHLIPLPIFSEYRNNLGQLI